MSQRFLVSVFIKGKCVHSYFSPNLDDLVTIKALYKGCELGIYDFEIPAPLSNEAVAAEVIKSRKRWKESLQRKRQVPAPKIEKPVKPKIHKKRIKYWKRRVICVETGQIFGSVRECSNRIGLPYTTIVNCIKNKNATRGLHFSLVENQIKKDEEEKQ